MRYFGRVVVGVLALGLLVISSPTRVVAKGGGNVAADPFFSSPPDVIGFSCLAKGDKVGMAAARASCDVQAEANGYKHGVVRPSNPSDFDEGDPVPICPFETTSYACVGVASH